MKWLARFALAGFAIGLVMVALPQLWYPFGFDQQVYAACGDVIRRGGIPIRDCFETKQMGVMLLYAVPIFFTRSPLAVHAFTLMWQAGTCVLLLVVARDLFKSWLAAMVAASLYWLMYAGINYWSMDQAETFSNVFLLAAFWLLLRSNSGPRLKPVSIIAAGALIGVAFWFKYVFALVGIALGAAFGVHLLLQPGFSGKLVRLRTFVAAYGIGVLAILAAGLTFYALVPRGLVALRDQLVFLRDNFPLAPPRLWPQILEQLARFVNNGADVSGDFKATLGEQTKAATVFGGGFPLIVGLALFGLIKGLFGRGNTSWTTTHRWSTMYLGIYVIAGLVIVAWQGNYIQYHFSLLLIPMALLAGAAFTGQAGKIAWSQQGPRRSRYIAWRALQSIVPALMTIGATFLLVLRMTPMVADAWQNVVVEQKPLVLMYLESKQGPNLAGGDYLRAHTSVDDSISVFGDAPWLYTLADRPNATNFAFVNVWIKKRGSESYDLFLRQWLFGLERNRPAYVVLTRENFPWPGNSYLDDYKLAQPIVEYVDANYRYEGEVGPFLMFRRK